VGRLPERRWRCADGVVPNWETAWRLARQPRRAPGRGARRRFSEFDSRRERRVRANSARRHERWPTTRLSERVGRALSRKGSATSQCAGTGADARWYFGPTVQPARRTVQTSEVDAAVKRRINARLRILQRVLPRICRRRRLGICRSRSGLLLHFLYVDGLSVIEGIGWIQNDPIR